MPVSIEQRIAALEARNAEKDANKAWETCLTRRLSIMAITYSLAVLFLTIIRAENAFLAALVPTFGFLLSTLSLSWIRAKCHK